MVDFNKIRGERNALAAKQLANPEETKAASAVLSRSLKSRISHLIDYHLGEFTKWEEDFAYNQKTYCAKNPNSVGTTRILSTVTEMEDKYCGAVCHALNKGGIGHG